MERLKSKIITQFACLCGIDIPAAAGFTDIIDQSIEEVTVMLNEGILPDEHAVLLSHLCAALCCYKYTLLTLLNQPDSIRAADISVSHNGAKALENAKRIREEALISARCLLKDDNFYFGRMK